MKKEILVFVIGIPLLVLAYFYLDVADDSLFGDLTNPLLPVNWDEVAPRNIVKNSIPVELLEESGNSCTVLAENFEMISSHQYFVRSQELIDKLQYDNQEKTLIIPCDELKDEISKLNVWYVVEESSKHPEKWEYFVTELED